MSSEVQSVQFFTQALQHECTVKLNDGSKFIGKLSLIDGSMNIVLENAEETVKGVKVNSYPQCFIRGNNKVCYISVN
ncbi:small nuclear ribonucleoprotein f, putative [Entamoeba invadens IP1]|uniref:Small nuclear ribonucleoprotein f, putative n=1 Tax=Entamoeba invadens IP1 TaxID=370355 RepID=A0A0A1U5I7_ENTIV|nr:small nuclear ribonucleoprotein f, putative [Entamoeba invadens IP1]ELP89492.1 small nuclear ribonucleoprotein f, putative [Entamoeba invadens IP1]|eukprot:XP_004256263.1 small nuclear ribonucleoprotein f, putative [Entamoeba invadens IP1]